ncbi:MAG TPA: GNAT family N-acetyltransferase, partial [Novosphingobium sp.]|nr:GNAT family N-acetyltransferase [Novosphingobium sp.]
FVTLPTSAAPAELIGCVGLGEVEGEVELGYWFARPHWGKGYATEAARAVLRLAKVLGHREIVAGHFIDNPASGKVLRKVGFVPTGRIRHRYSLARGYDAQSVEHRIALGRPSDCDGDADPAAAMRAA